MTKIIVILGQTAVGKTDLSIHLAKEFSGEVISADSRQVYRGLDIGTAKITPDEMSGVAHHLINVADPKETFTAADFRRLGDHAIREITARNKMPFVVGGTGFYIQSLVDNVSLPEAPPNPALRSKLAEIETAQLFEQLTALDPDRAKTIDPENRPRLIRAIEIVNHLGHVPKPPRPESRYHTLFIGLRRDPDELRQRIHARNIARLEDNALVTEVMDLHKNGLSWERMEALGLEYRYVSQFLRGEIPTRAELLKILDEKIWQFAKRQRTWWQRDDRIHWFHSDDQKAISEVVGKFLYTS